MRAGRSIAWLGIIAISFLFSVQISGCSLIGLMIGYSADRGTPKVRVIPAGQALQISPGARLTLRLKDGTVPSGQYIGVGRVSEKDYARSYGAWHDSLPADQPYPALGDSVTLTHRSGETRAATFGGFDYRQVTIVAADGGLSAAQFEELVSMSGPASPPILAEQMIVRDISGGLPTRSALKLRDGKDTTLVALDRITQIEVPSVRHSALKGFMIGLALDALVIAVAVSTQDEGSSSSGGCSSSGSSLGDFGSRVQPLEAPFDLWTGKLLADAGAGSGPGTAPILTESAKWVTVVDP